MHYLRRQPHFHRRSQMDHIFLFASGEGPRLWKSYSLFRADSIFLSVETKCPTWGSTLREWIDLVPCMSKWKDFVIPGHTDYRRMLEMRRLNLPSHQRDLLATFHGRYKGRHHAYELCGVRSKVVDDMGGLE